MGGRGRLRPVPASGICGTPTGSRVREPRGQGGTYGNRIASRVADGRGERRRHGRHGGAGRGADTAVAGRVRARGQGRAPVRSVVHLERAVADPRPEPPVRVRAQPDAPDDPRDLRAGAREPRVVGLGDHVLQRPARRADDRRHRPHRPGSEALRRRGRRHRDVHAGRHRRESRDRGLSSRPHGQPRGAPRCGASRGVGPAGPAAARIRDHRAPPGRNDEGARGGRPARRFAPDPHRMGSVLRYRQREVSRRTVSRSGPGRRPMDHRARGPARG